MVRARKPKRLPVVLTRAEVRAILTELDGVPRLVCSLLYGAGLRLPEGLALQKDRVPMLPGALLQALQNHLRRVRQQHEADLKSGLGQAPLPDALARKYPNAGREWGWQWVFPASSLPGPKDGHPASSPSARISDSKGGPSGGATRWAD